MNIPQYQLIHIQRSVAFAINEAYEESRWYSHRSLLPDVNLTDATKRIARKAASRRRIGGFDFHEGSHDMAVCTARAYRIQQRLWGNRLTFQQAMWG